MSQNREAMKIKSKRDAFNYKICLNMFTDTFPDLKSKVSNAKDQLALVCRWFFGSKISRAFI